ncbi:hypothetical protein [Thermosipho atlanticus]|uniref:DUF4203 domain-containing protein n=1 Tax=Thermosipho atlanticus DSM 15807 TaxID=1123380 RepID=A0A1M5TBL8_9BACT|nr:hypothetical protein [Thermosipho atlanticus]SHH47733.1 hypothetical protein SAMN02745199_1256 [Thermosipho atlanticus DSM 15807]
MENTIIPEGLLVYLRPVIEYWYYSLIIGIFLVFAAKFVEKISIALLGFLLGINVLFPVLLNQFPQLNELLTDPAYYQISMLVFGVIVAAVLFALYKSFVFIAGFGVVGIIGYYLADFTIQFFDIQLNFNPLYITALIGVILGLIGGIISTKKSSEVISIMSIVVGSATLSAVVVGLITRNNIEEKITEPLYSSIFIGVFLALVILGSVWNFKRSKKSEVA